MAMKPKGGSVTREVGPLSLRASVEPGSIDKEKRTVDVVWTTGARVLRSSWFDGSFYEELSLEAKHVRMGRLNGGAPLLNSHNGWDLRGVIGVVESARLEKGKGIATVRFARAEDDPDADAIFRKVEDGVIRNVSVGYRVYKSEKSEDGENQLPVMRAVDWEPYEISMVPMGADAGAGVRSAGAETNPCEFVLLQERVMAKKTPAIRTPAAAPVNVRADEVDEAEEEGSEEDAPAPEPETPAESGERSDKLVTKRERERIQGIRRIGRTLKTPADVVERHIDAGTPLAQFRAEAQDMYADNEKTIETGAPGQRIEAGQTAGEKYVRGASDWMIQRAAVEPQVIEAGKKRGETVKVDPGEFRGLSFVELARLSLERAGVRTAGWDRLRVLGEALIQRGGGQHATGDFATALENAMHKTLLSAYAVTPDTWSRFCAIGSVSDFRAHNRYRMGTFGSLSTVLEGGEFPNMTLADASKESLTAATKGGMVGITRQALINDDMGVFSQMASMVGRSAALTVEKDVYALLALNSGDGPTMADSVAMFHTSSHGANKTTSAAITVAALDIDRQAMASQRDPSSNEYLDLRPAVLLCGMAVGGAARVLNDAQYDPESNKFQKPNIVRGLFRDVVDTPRISGNRRYLFADPSVAPTIEVAFLDGQRSPYLEVRDGWRVDGVEWKVRLDYAVAGVDWRGAVTNAGG